MFMAGLDIKTAFDEARPRHIAKIMESHDFHGRLIAAYLREMSGLEGKAMFKCVESCFNFIRCLRQKKRRSFPDVANDGCATSCLRKHGSLVGLERGESASDMQLFVDRQLLDYVPLQKCLERMLRDLIEEVVKWDLAPTPASLWWTSTYEEEERSEVLIAANGMRYKLPSEEKFKILGCAMNSY